MGKYAAIWLMIALVLSIGYTYRLESYAIINRLLGELTPDRGQQLHKNATIFRASTNGHFYIRARVNGVFIRFMVDTGASDVVLSPIDAQRIGIDTKKLNYSRVYRTANGTVTGAPTTLSSVAIGYRQIENVRASVNSVALQNSLLGMSFLKRLKGYAVKDQTLTLYW
jgi:aspartyl protease family protein